MTTVHIQNTVQDFDTWKATFDKYERFRAEQGVRSYRVSRSLTDPNELLIDLEFGDQAAAEAFLPRLEQIMSSPQAQAQLVRHSAPRLYAVVTERIPPATGLSLAPRVARPMHGKESASLPPETDTMLIAPLRRLLRRSGATVSSAGAQRHPDPRRRLPADRVLTGDGAGSVRSVSGDYLDVAVPREPC